jgi:hypothetical protein
MRKYFSELAAKPMDQLTVLTTSAIVNYSSAYPTKDLK